MQLWLDRRQVVVRAVEILFLLAFVSLVSLQIFKAPFIGLADNGDFPKVTGRLSLGPKGPYEKFIYFTSDYVHSSRYRWKGPVIFSELVPAWIATSLVRNVGRTNNFDIRYLGALHLLLFASAYYLLLSLLRPASLLVRFGIAAFVMWVFSDSGYTAYLNSFYSDVTALLGLLLMVASALHIIIRQPPRGKWWTIFILYTLLFITSKAQHGMWGIFPAAFAMLVTLPTKRARLRTMGIVLCLIFIAASVIELRITPPLYKGQALYNLVFYKLTKQSPTPVQDLSALGLLESDAEYIGSTAYDHGSPAGDSRWLLSFYEHVGYKGVVHFYLQHPGRALQVLRSDLVSAAQVRPRQIGNYRRQDGVPPRTTTTNFSSWSNLRSRLFAFWPLHIAAWYAAVLLTCSVFIIRRGQTNTWRLAAVCASIACMAILEYCFASLADAIETNRHLFLFHTLTDLTVCFAVAALLHGVQVAARHAGRWSLMRR